MPVWGPAPYLNSCLGGGARLKSGPARRLPSRSGHRTAAGRARGCRARSYRRRGRAARTPARPCGPLPTAASLRAAGTAKPRSVPLCPHPIPAAPAPLRSVPAPSPLGPQPSRLRAALSARSPPPTPGDAVRCRRGAAPGRGLGARGARGARRGGPGRLLPVRRGARRRCHPQAGRRRLGAAAALRALPVLRRRTLRTLREYPSPRGAGEGAVPWPLPAAPTPAAAAASSLAPRRPEVE